MAYPLAQKANYIGHGCTKKDYALFCCVSSRLCRALRMYSANKDKMQESRKPTPAAMVVLWRPCSWGTGLTFKARVRTRISPAAFSRVMRASSSSFEKRATVWLNISRSRSRDCRKSTLLDSWLFILAIACWISFSCSSWDFFWKISVLYSEDRESFRER